MTNKELKLSVLEVTQPIGSFFIASMSAKDLVAISYSDVRRMVDDEREVEKYLGIQRPISKKRVKDIKNYLEGSDATFPTTVILAVDDRCAEYKEHSQATGTLTLSAHSPNNGDNDSDIPYERIANVLDGQHRIAAFMDEDGKYRFNGNGGVFEINVAIFVGADISEQANIFATVNLTQTKVNKSLAYDLTELAKTRSPHKSCHNIAVVLDGERRSPLYQRIKRLGVATPGREYEPLTQAGFVESLVKFMSLDPVDDRNKLLNGEKLERASDDELMKCPFRNMFIDGKDLDIAEILFNYFSAVRDKWPKSWKSPKDSRNLLPRSNAFKALMKFLKEDVYVSLDGDFGTIPKKSEFRPFFDPIKTRDEDFISKNFAPGSGGQSIFLKMLRQEISLSEMLEQETL